MRIGFFGDGPWAHQSLEKMIENSLLEVVFIVARFNHPDPWLKEYAQKANIPFLLHENVNHQEFVSKLTDFNADLFVSMSFDQIIRKDLLGLPTMGFINCHAGALPFYRGRNVLNWVLINGEDRFGVTVHYIDEGIDTGDIILQRFEKITPEDNYGTLLKKAYVLCADTLHQALNMLEKNQVNRIEQSSIHPMGSYFGIRKRGDEYIDWSWSSKRIFNFIRGITLPGPCARAFLNEKEVLIVSAEIIQSAPFYISTPGEIVGQKENGVVVKTGDTTLLITAIADVPINKTYKPKLRIGTRFNARPFVLKELAKDMAGS